MKKKFNTDAIKNELEGSVFFRSQPVAPSQPEPSTSLPEKTKNEPVIPRYRDTVVSSNHDTVIPDGEEELLEGVRKAVKQVGKEAATQRLTLEEKQALAEIEYQYKRQGIKTSGNELMRIATNYLVREYHQHGESSILAKVIKKLNS